MDVMWTVHNLDVFDAIDRLDDESVHLLLTDPPYFRVKDEPWDHSWDSPGEFLEWMGDWLAAVRPKLSKRGTVAVFTSPLMFGRVEAKVAETFSVFGNVVWNKTEPGWLGKSVNAARGPLPLSERIVFAEQAAHTDPWVASRERLAHAAAREAYADLINRLIAIRQASGLTNSQVDGILGTAGMSGHYFGFSQWALPTQDAWEKLLPHILEGIDRNGTAGDIPPPLVSPNGSIGLDYEDLRRDYEDLRRDYEDLRRDYEHLRRRWNSGPQGWQLLSDVWTFPTVRNGPGRHVCEKPTTMLRHIVELATDPDDLVVDLFAGSGSTGEAALSLGRRFVGNDAAAKWAAATVERCRWAAGEASPPDFNPVAVTGEPQQLRLA